ncbi:hypothetical protein [Poseidonibacter antarcticus]|uniref:hypothetical protein n=1 Tax=Poseidonibacter antarcticus TaxID=2478538 RepID=UPI000EF4E6CA|nr:hypothetical protein [Poseidonibacter antarcticus]
MIITYHAGQRFLERVIHKIDFTKYEVHRTVEYLQRVFKDVVPSSKVAYLPLPGFESNFHAVYKDNTILTIVPKKDKKC